MYNAGYPTSKDPSFDIFPGKDSSYLQGTAFNRPYLKPPPPPPYNSIPTPSFIFIFQPPKTFSIRKLKENEIDFF